MTEMKSMELILNFFILKREVQGVSLKRIAYMAKVHIIFRYATHYIADLRLNKARLKTK